MAGRTSKAAKAAPTAGQSKRTIATAAAPAPRATGIKVRATQLGYYDHTRRRIGDVFMIHSEQDFSTRWMERVPSSTPEKVTSMTEALKRQQQDLAGITPPEGGLGIQVGPDDVPPDLPSGAGNPIDAE